MKKRILEAGKDLLIVLLVCSLALLSAASLPVESIRSSQWLSALLQPIAPLLGLPQSELTYVKTALPVSDAAQPMEISVRNSMGRTTAIWNFDMLDALFETLGSMLGQALDTAGAFSSVSEARLQDALSGPSVYFFYDALLPADLLASWLDASMEDGGPNASAYILAVEDAAVTLYLSGDGCYAAATGVQAEALSSLLEQYRPDGSRFAFEDGSTLEGLTLLPGDDPSVFSAAVSNPCDTRFMEDLATDLGFNPYSDASYTDASGTAHFAESNCTLQIDADGQLLLSSTASDRFLAAGDELDALVEEARSLVSLIAGASSGDARIYLTGVMQDGDMAQCTFDYILSGIPVSVSGGHAATVTFQGQAVTQLQMRVATYTQTTELLYLLPIESAAAILSAGSRLALQYSDTGTGTLAAGWAQGN